MIGFLLISTFCGWFMWIQYLAAKMTYNNDIKKGEGNLGGIIVIYLFRCSWAIFLIIYSFINMVNK